MYTFLLMAMLWLAFGAGFSLFMPVWAGSLIAVVLTAIIMFFIGRKLMNIVSAGFTESQKALQKGNQGRAIRILEDMKQRYGRWQFQLDKQVDSQIGTIHYLRRDYDTARQMLEKGLDKHWVGISMLGVIHYRQKNYDLMRSTMDRAVKKNAKQPILWALYAWCEQQLGNRDQAIALLQKGIEKNSKHAEGLKENLTALQNGKKMKMKLFGEQWYQYMLEMPRQQQPQRHQRGGFQGRPSAAQLRAAQRMQGGRS